ncbi:MAG: class I SAM-dependent methyltransferase [Negativicutes bacterium]|jgi:SAM-dependent methyltransferase
MSQRIGHFDDEAKVCLYYSVVEAAGRDDALQKESYFSAALAAMPADFSGKRVLDIGGGNGAWSELFHERNAKEVVYLDKSPAMYQLAAERKKTNCLQRMLLLQIGIEEYLEKHNKHRFDFIFSSFSLMYFVHIRELLTTIAALLNPGGEMMIITNILTVENPAAQPEQELLQHTVKIELGNESRIVLDNLIQPLSHYLDGLNDGGVAETSTKFFSSNYSRICPEYDNPYKASLNQAVIYGRKTIR